jgi:hypothetical protein
MSVFRKHLFAVLGVVFPLPYVIRGIIWILDWQGRHNSSFLSANVRWTNNPPSSPQSDLASFPNPTAQPLSSAGLSPNSCPVLVLMMRTALQAIHRSD